MAGIDEPEDFDDPDSFRVWHGTVGQVLGGQPRSAARRTSDLDPGVRSLLEAPTQILEPFHRRYETLAVRIGLVGNGLFVAGSVLFMFSSGLPAKLCWLLGSIGMLVRAVGRLYADRRAEQEQFGGAPMAAARRELDTAPE